MQKFDTVLTESYYSEAENLLLVKLKDGPELSLENVILHNEETYEVMGEKVTKVIYDVRHLEFTHIPKEVLKYIADSPHGKYQEAEAFLINGLGQKLIANFYLAVMNPKTKTKVFTSFEQALDWHKVTDKKTFLDIYKTF